MATLRNIVDRIASRPRLCAPILGALAACGFAPLGLWPLTLLAMAGLIELTARAPGWKQAALTGWLFGLGHFALGNNWIATAFTYQAKMPGWLGGIAVAGLALYLAVYPALAAAGAWVIAKTWFLPPSPSGEGSGVGFARMAQPLPTNPTPTPPLKGRGFRALTLAFAAAWVVSEWLRGWVFTGFAWNPLAMAALGPFARPGLAVLAPWLGTYALSGLVALLAGAWLIALKRGKIDWRGAVLVLGPAVLMLLPNSVPAEQGSLAFTLVQPDIRQEDLDNPANYETQFAKIADLSLPRRVDQTRLVLWPESGVPDYLRDGYPAFVYEGITFDNDPRRARKRIGWAIGPGSLLLTGTTDLEIRGGDAAGARNVVTALDSDGTIRGSYAKAHLVPGGEYLPLRPLLEPLGASRLVPGSIDFWPGPGPRTMDLGRWGKAGMQICYEIVFSGEVVDRSRRPDYIFNPSNDGWFGSWGPPQHLAQARLRAIEEGLPVLRATTTGISAVIDANGIVRQHVPRHRAGRLDGLVPPAHAPTLFSRTGNLLPLGWAAVLLVLSLVAMRRRQS